MIFLKLAKSMSSALEHQQGKLTFSMWVQSAEIWRNFFQL